MCVTEGTAIFLFLSHCFLCHAPWLFLRPKRLEITDSHWNLPSGNLSNPFNNKDDASLLSNGVDLHPQWSWLCLSWAGWSVLATLPPLRLDFFSVFVLWCWGSAVFCQVDQRDEPQDVDHWRLWRNYILECFWVCVFAAFKHYFFCFKLRNDVSMSHPVINLTG